MTTQLVNFETLVKVLGANRATEAAKAQFGIQPFLEMSLDGKPVYVFAHNWDYTNERFTRFVVEEGNDSNDKNS